MSISAQSKPQWQSEPPESFLPPLDDFTRRMLSSIPRKTVDWLERLGQQPAKKVFAREGLRVGISGKHGRISIPADDYMVRDTKITWTYEDDGTIDQVETNNPTLTNITENLDYFILMEKRIYDVLNALEQKRGVKHGKKIVNEMKKRGVDARFIKKFERGLQTPETATIRSDKG